MEIRQGQGQHQRLLINMAMRQAFTVLQMPLLELGQWVEERIEENPILEKVESRAYYDAKELPARPSLYGHLMQQVEMGDFDDREKSFAREIIGNLDERGFYLGPIGGRKQILKKVQELDPPGIGATSLQESFLLQLEAAGEKDSPRYLKIRDAFESCSEEVKGLNLAPGLSFHVSPFHTLTPDVIVNEEITVSDAGIPEFEVSPYYTSYHEKGVSERYLRNQLAEAKWMLRNIEKRASTLEAITRFLVERGSGYFRGESRQLPTASVGEVAQALELHPSTISRAIKDKSLLSLGGHVPFKAFFSKTGPKDLLKTLISIEKRAFSDHELADQLGLARRTVTKYRQELGIPNSHARKGPPI